ncbi:MAG: sigma-54-dependent Fis family transcriptional regulator [Deltaproteobacteria bacterium]|nr:sigma-54-dependent Fis family transcriptional regulator [Deltaproteobacteria bacterium]
MSRRNTKILIVDDEPDMAENLSLILRAEGYDTVVETKSLKAIDVLEGERPDLAIVDLRMPEMDGLALLERVKDSHPEIAVILLTGFATVDSAVEAMKKGASDYLSKPFSPTELLVKIDKALAWNRMTEENRLLRQQVNGKAQYGELVGKSRAFTDLLLRVDKIALTDARVLITGESGTGKELVARAIYRRSLRRDRRFFVINCGALTETLLESELFGYERGAFTGAITTRKGIFEVVDGGTLFLDEVTETSLSFQAKLLRVVELGEFLRVGGTRSISTDVRLICSSNRDLTQAVADGRLRQDLFYRLSVVQVQVPPLRERVEDIPLLANHFLQKYSSQFGREVRSFSPDAELLLRSYRWPGNVRELRNVIERAVLLGTGDTVTAEEFPKEMSSSLRENQEESLSLRLPENGLSLNKLEKQLVKQALEIASGNQVRAAGLLGISRDALRNRLKKYGLM